MTANLLPLLSVNLAPHNTEFFTTSKCRRFNCQQEKQIIVKPDYRGGRGRGWGITFGFLRIGKDHTHTVQSSDVDNI